MNTQTRRSSADDARHIKIAIEGSPDEVERMLQRLAGGANVPDFATRTPDQLFLSRAVAAQRSGIAEDRLSALVRHGRLANHGTARRMLFSLAEIRAAVGDGQD